MLITWTVLIALAIAACVVVQMRRRARRPLRWRQVRAVEDRQVVLVQQIAKARQEAADATAQAAVLGQRVAELEDRRAA